MRCILQAREALIARDSWVMLLIPVMLCLGYHCSGNVVSQLPDYSISDSSQKFDSVLTSDISIIASDIDLPYGPIPLICASPPSSTLIRNVKEFGAIGDSVTNDRKAIQAAIDEVGGTDGTVYVPSGRYLIQLTEVNNNGVGL